MRIRALALIFILSFSYIPIPSAQAQIGAPDVNLECASGTVDIEVYPGSSAAGSVTCTVSNPNSYQEKIDIQVNAEGLAVSAPSSITLGPNGEEDFIITVKGEERMSKQTRQMVVTATVTEVMGAPPPNIAQKEVNLIVNIKQFAGLQLEAREPSITLESNVESIVNFTLYNTGNSRDNFLLAVNSNSMDNLLTAGFKVSLPKTKVQVDEGYVEMIRLFIETPDDYNSWDTNSDGDYEATFILEFEARSEFSCNNGGCFTEFATVTITVTHEAESTVGLITNAADNQILVYGGGGAGVILLLLLVMALRKRKKTE